MENKIKLGYEIETGKQVDVKPSHLIVTGVTQLSGKTTTLEALIKRSGLKAIISKVLARVPSGGMKTYEVAPLEKLKKDFLEDCKNKVINETNNLDEESKKIVKFLESLGRRTNISEIMEKGLLLKPASGSRSRVQKKIQELFNLEISRKDGGHIYANLKEKVKKFMGTHEAKEQEIEQVYNHILMEILNQEKE